MKKEQLQKVSDETLNALTDALNKFYGEITSANEVPSYELNAMVAMVNVERERRKTASQEPEQATAKAE